MKNSKPVTIFGDQYFFRRTFDILHYCALEGFDVFDEQKKFLFHYDNASKDNVVSEVEWRIYHNFNLNK